MKRTALIIAAAMLSTMAMARTYQFSAQNATRSPIAIAWYQGEDILQTISDASISNTDAVVWDVVSATNYSLTYIITTGTVYAVTNATFSVSPSNSNLSAGDYIGFVRTIKIDQQNAVTAQTIIARQTIRVLPASDTRTTSYRGPMTQCLIETDPLSVHTNQIGSGLGIVNGLLAATGSPVGAESDPIWRSASNSYYLRSQVDSRFATGTPLYAYAESDPSFSAWLGTNTYNRGDPLEVFSDAGGTVIISKASSYYIRHVASHDPTTIIVDTNGISSTNSMNKRLDVVSGTNRIIWHPSSFKTNAPYSTTSFVTRVSGTTKVIIDKGYLEGFPCDLIGW